MRTQEQYEELAKQKTRTICPGTTCSPYVELVGVNGQYALYHKKGHTSYINRLSGTAHCEGFWLVIDLEAQELKDNHGHKVQFPLDYKRTALVYVDGRWNKEKLQMIRKYFPTFRRKS